MNSNTDNTTNTKAAQKGKLSIIKALIIVLLASVLIALAIFLIGPQCRYDIKVSEYREEQCTNRTGYKRLTYCKEHMYIEELPQAMIRALDTWDYELMKNTLAEAEAHEMRLTTTWKVEDHIEELGAKKCRFPNCPLYIPQERSFCPEHEYAQELMDDFCAAIVDYDVQKINSLYEESSAIGLNIRSYDQCVQEGVDLLIDSYLANYDQADVSDLALRLHHLHSLFSSNFDLEPESFDKMMFLIRTQGVNLKKMDPNQGYYAGQENSKFSSSNGLLSSSGGRTYGYNYEIYSRSSRAAALNNAPTIESSSAVYYKDIEIGDSMGYGIWAIETPDFDIVALSNESISFIDNSKQEIAYKFYVSDYSREKMEVVPVHELPSEDGSEAYFLIADDYWNKFGMLVRLNDEGVITDMLMDIVNEDDVLATFPEQFIGKKGPFVDGVNISIIPEERYYSQAVIDAVNNLYGGEAAAQAIKDAVEAEAQANAEAAAQAESEKIRTATVKGMMSDVTVTLTMENGVIVAITVDSSNETPTYGTRCATDEAFLSQFIGQSLPVEGVDAVSGATTTSNAVIEAVNSLAN